MSTLLADYHEQDGCLNCKHHHVPYYFQDDFPEYYCIVENKEEIPTGWNRWLMSYHASQKESEAIRNRWETWLGKQRRCQPHGICGRWEAKP